MTGSASAGCSADESDSAANPVDPEPEAQGSPGDEAPADPEHLAAGGDPVITDDAQAEPAGPRRRRRVRTEPVPGTDPHPVPESPRHDSAENDDRLHADKPPHY